MYVISQDAKLLLQEWGKMRDFVIPSEVEFVSTELAKYLQNIFPSVEFVFANDLQSGISNLVKRSAFVPVSLDRVYFQGDLHLDITRAVNDAGDDVGVIARHGYESLSAQVNHLKSVLQEQQKIVLVDDVIFSGELLSKLIDFLESQNLFVPAVVAGVAIDAGVRVLNEHKVEVFAVRTFTNVIDEICERDFLPGVPMSGRSVVGNEKIGAPYILPFGRPQAWASIPSVWEKRFSKFCLNLAAEMFDLIGQASSRQVFARDLERCPIGIDVDDQRSFTDILRAKAALL